MSHGDREQTSNTQKKPQNTALNTLLGGVSQLADRNKRNRGCTERVEPTWCCHGNHIPLWWWETNLERVRAEDRRGQHTQSHHLYLPLPLHLIKREKHHHGWTAPILMSSISKLAITLAVKMTIQQSAHCSFSHNSATFDVCAKHRYVLL